MPDTAPTWRVPGPADAEALGRMHRRAWQDTYGARLPDSFFDEWDEAASVEGWRARLARPRDPEETLLASFGPDGEVLGWVHVGVAPTEEGIEPARRLRLHGLYVVTAAHGTGLGPALLDAALGDRPAEVWLIDGNDRAEAFYHRRGFRRDGTTGPHLASGLPGVRMVR